MTQKIEKFIFTLAVLITAFCILSISLYAIRSSTDEFWHIKTGEYIVQHGYKLPQTDIFTFTAEKYPWVNHEWLSQIVFFHVYHTTGFKGFVVFKSVIILAAFGLVYLVARKVSGNSWISLAVTLLAALASRHTLYPRPFIFTYLFIPVYLYYLYDIQEKGAKLRDFLLFPLLMVVWVNLHGGSILGIMLPGFFLAGNGIRWVWKSFIKKTPEPDGLKIVLHLGIITGSVALASLINPWGWHVFELTSKVMTDKNLVSLIGELQPPDFNFTHYYLVLLILTGLAVIPSFKKVYLADVLLLLFFGQQSLSHVRHLPLYSIIAAPIVSRHIVLGVQYLTNKGKTSIQLWIPRIVMISIVGLAFHILILNHQLELNREFMTGPGYRESSYPVKACDFLMSHPFTGRLFNEINSSGYIMFRVFPRHKIFTDNRFDLFGSDFLPDFYTILLAKPEMNQTLDKWDINLILFDYKNPDTDNLFFTLSASTSWVMAYQDETYAIYLRNHPRNTSILKAIENRP